MIKSNDEYAALAWLRKSVPGRILRSDLQARIKELRELYENNPADETTRKLLQQYKAAENVLFSKSMEEGK